MAGGPAPDAGTLDALGDTRWYRSLTLEPLGGTHLVFPNWVSGYDQRHTHPIEVTYDPKARFPGVPSGRDNPELLRLRSSHGHDMSIVNGIGRIGYMRGGNRALWKDEEMAEVFLDRALSFVTAHKAEPFFLYYAFHQPHVPRVPGPRFAGARLSATV